MRFRRGSIASFLFILDYFWKMTNDENKRQNTCKVVDQRGK